MKKNQTTIQNKKNVWFFLPFVCLYGNKNFRFVYAVNINGGVKKRIQPRETMEQKNKINDCLLDFFFRLRNDF